MDESGEKASGNGEGAESKTAIERCRDDCLALTVVGFVKFCNGRHG
jgi:hypothetical protein